MAFAAGPDADHALRWKTTDDLKAYLDQSESAETAWLSPDRQHEEAWFLGLRLNAGVDPEDLKHEFGEERVDAALTAVDRLSSDGLLQRVARRVCLTAQGRLLSNEVFQEFLGIAEAKEVVSRSH